MGATTIEVPAQLEAIKRICSAVDEAAEQAGFSQRTSYSCQLAVSEACENIVLHGFKGEAGGTIAVDILAEEGRLTVRLTDDGPAFDPASVQPGPPEPPEDPPAGGLGLLILHRVMDEIRYERANDQNRLLLRKVKVRSQSD